MGETVIVYLNKHGEQSELPAGRREGALTPALPSFQHLLNLSTS